MTDTTNERDKMQWNLGGWLGGQLGGSIWMLLAGSLTLPKNFGLGMTIIGLFCLINIAGYVLWRRRERISAYAAMQSLMSVIGVCGVSVVYLLDRAHLYEEIQIGGRVSAAHSYVLLLAVVVGLMLVFYLRFGRSS